MDKKSYDDMTPEERERSSFLTELLFRNDRIAAFVQLAQQVLNTNPVPGPHEEAVLNIFEDHALKMPAVPEVDQVIDSIRYPQPQGIENVLLHFLKI